MSLGIHNVLINAIKTLFVSAAHVTGVGLSRVVTPSIVLTRTIHLMKTIMGGYLSFSLVPKIRQQYRTVEVLQRSDASNDEKHVDAFSFDDLP